MKKLHFSLVFFVSILFTSCFQDEDILEDFTQEIEILPTAYESRVGFPVKLLAITKAGKDVTAEVKFIVNNVEQASNEINSSITRTFIIQGKYKEKLSSPIEVKYSNSVLGFKKNAIVEDYTGTWCGNCPRVTHALEQIKQLYTNDKVVDVAIHRGTPQQNEPFVFNASVLEQAVSVTGYPSARINRNIVWSAQQQNNLIQVVRQTMGETVKMGVAIENSVSNGNVNLKLKIGAVESFSNLKIVVYVLENGLIYDQVNYTPFYGGLDPIPNFVHNHTLRSCATNLIGDAIPDISTTSGLLTTYTKDFTFPVPANVANIANIEFVAFVIDASGGAINVRKCLPNVVQDFEKFFD